MAVVHISPQLKGDYNAFISLQIWPFTGRQMPPTARFSRIRIRVWTGGQQGAELKPEPLVIVRFLPPPK